jgi:hypothetical protein
MVGVSHRVGERTEATEIVDVAEEDYVRAVAPAWLSIVEEVADTNEDLECRRGRRTKNAEETYCLKCCGRGEHERRSMQTGWRQTTKERRHEQHRSSWNRTDTAVLAWHATSGRAEKDEGDAEAGHGPDARVRADCSKRRRAVACGT